MNPYISMILKIVEDHLTDDEKLLLIREFRKEKTKFNDIEEQLSLMLQAMRMYDANNTCMSVDECSKFLGVHKNTILNRIHAGEIKTNLIGRVHSIPKLQFLEKIIVEE